MEFLNGTNFHALEKVIDIYLKAGDSIITLWNFYMVASFAAAGFALTKEVMKRSGRRVVAVGYSLFLAGHLVSICHAITLKINASHEINDLTKTISNKPELLKSMTSTYDSGILWQSILIHLAIDGCVLLLILYSHEIRMFATPSASASTGVTK